MHLLISVHLEAAVDSSLAFSGLSACSQLLVVDEKIIFPE